MKITFEEVLSRNEWIHKELMRSLTPELITQAYKDRFYDIKININGINVEPNLFNDIISNIDEYVTAGAQVLYNEKIDAIQSFCDEKIKSFIEELRDKSLLMTNVEQ